MHAGDPQAMHYWAGAAVCGAIASWALYRCLLSLRRDRLLADTPLVKIRSAAQGYVKLYGHAAAGSDALLAAPLTSRPCVWWRYNVEQKFRNSKGESRWESIDSGTSVNLFVLEDADAHCLVGPVNAEITPTTRNVWYGSEPRPCGIAPRSGLLQTGDYRYTESLLSESDKLSVLGELRSHSELGSTDASVAALLAEWKHDQKTLLARFDRNHDGRIDAGEWEAARQAAISETQANALKSPITRMSVISQPTNGEPFLIAAMDDAHLVRREQIHAALFFCLGLSFVTMCAWAIEHARSMAASTIGRDPLPLPLFLGLGTALVVFVARVLKKRAA